MAAVVEARAEVGVGVVRALAHMATRSVVVGLDQEAKASVDAVVAAVAAVAVA